MPLISAGTTQFCLLHMWQKFIIAPKRWLNGRVYRYFCPPHTRSITVRLPAGQSNSDAFWVNVFIWGGEEWRCGWEGSENKTAHLNITPDDEVLQELAQKWIYDLEKSNTLHVSFFFFLRDWKCSPATTFPRSGRYKYFTYKYLYQLCGIGFAWRNTLVSDLCLSLRFPSLQSII